MAGLGLSRYWPQFITNGYSEPEDLEDLKMMSKDAVKDTFKVYKAGHVKKILQAIKKLQYPNMGKNHCVT